MILTTAKPFVVKTDSLLKTINLDSASLSFYEIDLGKPLALINHNKLLIEKYGKIFETDPDSIYRYYDENLNNIPFSFSKKLDQKIGKKLRKTTFIYLSSVDKNNQIKPRIESITTFEKMQAKNTKEYAIILERFKEDQNLIK